MKDIVVRGKKERFPPKRGKIKVEIIKFFVKFIENILFRR